VGEDRACDIVRSLPLGFLRLAYAFNGPGARQRLSRYVRLECERVRFQLGRFDTLLLSGGTARAVGKLCGRDRVKVNATELISLCEWLSTLSPSELTARGVDPRRSATLPVGAAVLAGIVAGFGQRDVAISPRGLREGVLLRELDRRAPTVAA
jgi:exopolyphosphatase/guanosine-5'-triphosphate,3'-diphosphate pyrophosphatase